MTEWYVIYQWKSQMKINIDIQIEENKVKVDYREAIMKYEWLDGSDFLVMNHTSVFGKAIILEH